MKCRIKRSPEKDIQHYFEMIICEPSIQALDNPKFIVSNQKEESISTPVFSGHSKRRQKYGFQIDYRLIQVKCIAKCSKRDFCNTFDLH